MTLSNEIFLRRTIIVDAVASGASALLLIGGAGLLAGPLGLPEALIREAGILLIPFIALLGWIVRTARAPAGALRAVIAINVAWVLASLGTIFVLSPTPLGTGFVVLQALVVLGFAEAQLIALRRLRRPANAAA
jgi:hypothetical protein